MKNHFALPVLTALFLFTLPLLASAETDSDSTRIAALLNKINALDDDDIHCEVPCGIYGDSLRIALIEEHIRTVEKAMNKINEISKSDSPNYNQLVRWVMNKEEHAEKIQHIVSQYFLHQRIKLTDPTNAKKHAKYVKHLTHLHEISVYAMKCKQSTDLKNIVKIKTAVDTFEDAYFHSHK